MPDIWKEDLIGLVKRMGNEEQKHENTGINQENVCKLFYEQIESEEEKKALSDWEKTMKMA